MDVKYTCRIEDATSDEKCIALPVSMHDTARENSALVADILGKVHCLREYLFADCKSNDCEPTDPRCLMDEISMQGSKLKMIHDELSVISAKLGL